MMNTEEKIWSYLKAQNAQGDTDHQSAGGNQDHLHGDCSCLAALLS